MPLSAGPLHQFDARVRARGAGRDKLASTARHRADSPRAAALPGSVSSAVRPAAIAAVTGIPRYTGGHSRPPRPRRCTNVPPAARVRNIARFSARAGTARRPDRARRLAAGRLMSRASSPAWCAPAPRQSKPAVRPSGADDAGGRNCQHPRAPGRDSPARVTTLKEVTPHPVSRGSVADRRAANRGFKVSSGLPKYPPRC